MKDRGNRNSTVTYKFNLQVFGWLLLASLLACLASIPYLWDLFYRDSATPLSQILINKSLDFVLLTLPLASLGLWLSPKVGLGAPEIEAIVNKVPKKYRRLQSSIMPAVVLGTVGGIFVQVVAILSQSYLPAELNQIELPSFLSSLLVSFSAGVNEEIWFRLGVMTCLVWLGSKLMRRSKPSKAIIWSANLLAALLFAAIHLPQAFVFAEELPLFMVVFVLSLNSFVGVIFGWLYWRHGLLAAMIAHFSTDVIIHVLPAFVRIFLK